MSSIREVFVLSLRSSDRRYFTHTQQQQQQQTETCSFSGHKIYPGTGKTFIEKNGKLHRFISSKSESLHHQRKKAQKLTWTTMWRTLHKKGAQTLSSRKTRKKRVIRSSRNIGTVSIADIRKRRSEKAEFRKAQRSDAVRKLKERKKARKSQKKTTGPRVSKPFQKSRRR
jgi:large subunit ribosomal protein L24e